MIFPLSQRHIVKKFTVPKAESHYFALTSFFNAMVSKDLGLSMGSPRARSQIRDAIQPRARETPNKTV